MMDILLAKKVKVSVLSPGIGKEINLHMTPMQKGA